MSAFTPAEIEIKNLVLDIARKKDYEDCVLTINPLQKKGEGFLGKIFFVKVSSHKKEQDLEIVAKVSITDEQTRKIFHIDEIYNNEIHFYTRLYPALQQFQSNKGTSNLTIKVPKFFQFFSSKSYEILFFENVIPNGYEKFDKRQQFDKFHMTLVLEEFAKFHGFSFAYKDQKPEEFKSLVQPIKSQLRTFFDNPLIIALLEDILATMKSTVDAIEDENLSTLYHKYLKNTREILIETSCYDPKYCVIVHGDSWSNNMMFKYKKMPQAKFPIPNEVCLLDWQLIDYSSPVRDLLYLIFSSGSKEAFDNLETCLSFYYEKLSSYIREFGSDPEKLYPYTKLKEEWKKYSRFGMLFGFVLNKAKLTRDDDLITFEDVSNNVDISRNMAGVDRVEFDKIFLDILLYMYQANLL